MPDTEIQKLNMEQQSKNEEYKTLTNSNFQIIQQLKDLDEKYKEKEGLLDES